jgi:hypothetical protein
MDINISRSCQVCTATLSPDEEVPLSVYEGAAQSEGFVHLPRLKSADSVFSKVAGCFCEGDDLSDSTALL